MGASFRLPCVSATDAALLEWLRASGAELWAAAMVGEPVGMVIASGEAGTRPGRRAPIAIVVGNEGSGIRPVLLEAAGRRVAIPLRGPAESLNAAVAAAILLYEVTRDR